MGKITNLRSELVQRVKNYTTVLQDAWIGFMKPFVPDGGTPLYGLNGYVWPDRVWFLEGFVLNRGSISSIFVLNRVSLHDLKYSLTTEPSQKANVLPVCQCTAY